MLFYVLEKGFHTTLWEFVGDNAHRHYLKALLILSDVNLHLLRLECFTFDPFCLDCQSLGLLLDDSSALALLSPQVQKQSPLLIDIALRQVPPNLVILDCEVLQAQTEIEAVEFALAPAGRVHEFLRVTHATKGSLERRRPCQDVCQLRLSPDGGLEGAGCVLDLHCFIFALQDVERGEDLVD